MSKIKILPGNMDELGDWSNSYKDIKLGYYNADYVAKYADECFALIFSNCVIGYYFVTSKLVTSDDEIIPKYFRKLVLYDFAIDARSYAKLGKELINHLIKFATKNGYSAIEIKNIKEYSFFVNFINRYYKTKEFNDSIYILIDNFKVKTKEKNLRIYNDDMVTIEDLYFLYDLNFKVLRKTLNYKLDEDKFIEVDRISGKILFPEGVNLINDEVILNHESRKIIHLIINMNKKNLNIFYDLNNPFYFEVSSDNVLYVNKLNKDIKYLVSQLDKGITSIDEINLRYDVDYRMFSNSSSLRSVYSLINEYSSNSKTLKEKLDDKRKINDFNRRLKSLKRFDLRFGNDFCGIKKFAIFLNNEIEIKSNAIDKIEVNVDKEILFKELECFNFANWKSEYNSNETPSIENAWTISLLFDNEAVEYRGLDDYPKVWEYVKWFIKKYSNLVLEEE